MLQDVDKTLEKLLRDQGKIPRDDIDIEFDTPTREWSGTIGRPTLNCWCFDIRENLKLRPSDSEMQRMNGQMGRHYFPPKRMDLGYLVTAWARKIEDEHALIWRALQTFKRFHALDPDMCEGTLRYQTREMPMVVADMSQPRANLSDLWSVLDNEMRLGFMLVLTVELDVLMEIESPLVLTATVRVGQSDTPADETLSALDVEIVHDHEPEADD